jgi:hypothetical protein
MKPNFALNLTHESISLLHRTSRGWLEVGLAALDAPDLGEALGYLRKSALGLSPSGFTTKLIIPNSQILYLELDVPGPTDAKRRNQIKKALEGRTPYAVADLVFDWSGEAPNVKVAVVARETLEEAEGFAVQHRFNPVSFVAMPEAGDFPGEPFFGRSTFADSLLAKGEKVEPDTAPVAVIARDIPRPDMADGVLGLATEVADIPPAEATVVPDDARGFDEAAADEAAADSRAEAGHESGTAEPAAAMIPAATLFPELETSSASDADPPPADRMPPVTAKADAPETETSPAESDAADVATPAVASAAIDEPQVAASETTPVEAFPELAASAEDAAASPAENAQKTQPEHRPIPSVLDDALVPDAPVALDVEPLADEELEPVTPRFATRRQSLDATVKNAPQNAEGRVVPMPLHGQSAKPSSDLAAVLKSPKAGAKAGNDGDLRVIPGMGGAKATAGSVTAPGIPGLAPERRARIATPIADPRAKLPAVAARAKSASPTGFGVNAPVVRKGRPRYLGLILTGVLLLLLAAVAAWSSFYLASVGQDTNAPTAVAGAESSSTAGTEVAAGIDGTGDATDLIDAPSAIEDEMLADAQDPADFAAAPVAPEVLPANDALTVPSSNDAAAAVADAPIVAEQPAPDASPPLVSSDPAPVATVDGGAAPAPAPDAQDEIFLSAMDAPPPAQNATALSRPQPSPDSLPSAQLVPPPFGTQYQFDANGRIVPTPEGVITPDGITLFAGQPDTLPPPRPGAIAGAATGVGAPSDPANPLPAPAAADPAALSIPAESIPADPALAAPKPRARPEGLVPTSATTSPSVPDDAVAPLPVDLRLAGSRPRARPSSVAELAAAARDATQSASLASDPSAGPVSPLALAISGRPAPRPGDFSQAVEAAVAAAVRESPTEQVASPPAEQPTQQATLRVRKPEPSDDLPAVAAPEADAEPEVDDSGPRVASSGTVAKRATFANAINLSKTNLIGVYGTSNARYALIRQANGRYKKVEVGDRIDGGTVAAITASEVRYQKSGRIYNLTLPNG